MRKVFLFGLPVFVLALGLLFTGCDSGDSTPDLPISTVSWEEGNDGFVQFYTNDSQYYSYYFVGIFDNAAKGIYEIECKKISGSQKYAYGMIFGAANTGTENFFALLVDCQGYFSILKRDGDNETLKTDWINSSNLLSGYNKINTLKVTESGSTYTIFINGVQVHKFTDSAGFGNRIGYFASIGPEKDEKFPNSPVDVRFRMN